MSELVGRLPELTQQLCELGATEVILFGSLATGATPHAGTDIDLAVRGLSIGDVQGASFDLSDRVGDELSIVRLETAYPELLALIAQCAAARSPFRRRERPHAPPANPRW